MLPLDVTKCTEIIRTDHPALEALGRLQPDHGDILGTANRGANKVMFLTSITIVLEYKLACWSQMYAWYYGWLTATTQITHR